MSKTNSGRFFEDYQVGETIRHSTPRTISSGERALYHAFYPARHALFSSDEFARKLGLSAAPLDPLLSFHMIFGKTVPDISLNAVANLGYAEGRFHRFLWIGDTIRSESEIIGKKPNSNGKTGIVWVRTRGFNQREELVLEYVRWVMIRKRNSNNVDEPAQLPKLQTTLRADQLVIPETLRFQDFDFGLSGEAWRFKDYQLGEVIEHVDGVTLEEAEHMLATRLWQNTAKVHFDSSIRQDGKRLIYGGHIISMAHALSFNGLANNAPLIGINAGSHVNPAHAGDTIYARSEILDKHQLSDSTGAMRIRLIATKTLNAPLRDEDGKYGPDILLDFDYWSLIPV